MKKIRTLISSGTILPSLLMSGVINVQSVVAGPVGPGVMMIAQAATTPNEEEIRRRLEAEKLKQHPPGTAPANPAPHPTTQPVSPAPVLQKPPTPPPAPTHAAPVVPSTPVKPLTPPPAPIVPAPSHATTPTEASPKPFVPPTPVAPAPTHVVPVVPSTPVKPQTPPPAPTEPVPGHTGPIGIPARPPTPVAPVQGHTPPAPAVTPTQPAIIPHPVGPVTPQAPNPAVTNPGPVRVVPLPGAPANPQIQPAPRPGLPPNPGVPNPVGQPSTMAPQFPPHPQPQPGNQPKHSGITPLEAGAVGLAVGVVGGMIIGQQVHGLNEVQTSRQTIEQNGATFYSEPGRVIVREGDGLYVRHDETERFREFGTDVRVEQRGNQTVQIVDRPDHTQIVTITDSNGQLLKRLRRLPNGTEVVLIDNSFRPRPQHFSDEVIVVSPPPMTLPPEQYEVDAGSSDEGQIYEALAAPPLAALPRRYTLDEVRYSRDLRQYMRSVELNSITFSTGSWAIEDSEIGNLKGMADAINRAIKANPNEIFLVEGHTDAVGADVDNLSLSDRRAQTVAGILTRSFNVPPENLTTQGYGSQFLKVQTQEAERQNRRVTLRRVTPLLAGGTAH